MLIGALIINHSFNAAIPTTALGTTNAPSKSVLFRSSRRILTYPKIVALFALDVVLNFKI